MTDKEIEKILNDLIATVAALEAESVHNISLITAIATALQNSLKINIKELAKAAERPSVKAIHQANHKKLVRAAKKFINENRCGN